MDRQRNVVCFQVVLRYAITAAKSSIIVPVMYTVYYDIPTSIYSIREQW